MKLRKLVALLILATVVMGMTLGATSSKQRKLPKISELTPEWYVSLETTDEETLNSYFENKYKFEFIGDSSSCFCRNIEDGPTGDIMMSRPILVSYKGEIVLLYTSTKGVLMRYNSTYDAFEPLARSVHTDSYEEEGKVLMVSNMGMALTYDTNNCEVTQWEFNEIKDSWKLPTGAVFCGYSLEMGYIFRQGTDVYALIGNSITGGELKIIAHGVKTVVESDYYYDITAFSVPLFLMEDGTLKAYINEYIEINEELDVEEYLKVPCHEGGCYELSIR